MILYDNVCTPCARKQDWRNLRHFATKNNLSLVRVDVRNEPKRRTEAEQYGIDYPFVVHGKVALSLSEPLEELLK